MTYKSITQNSYEATAEEFADNVAALAPLESIEKFIKLLPPNPKIVDIGSGSGRDAKIFTEKGVSVLGIDLCQNLLEIAKKNAPLATFQTMDIENITLPASHYEGAWACCSLIHVPKQLLPGVLQKIHAILKPKGHFYISLKIGFKEGIKKDSRYQNCEKFVSFHEQKGLREILHAAQFHILEMDTVQPQFAYQTDPAVRAFCQKI